MLTREEQGLTVQIFKFFREGDGDSPTHQEYSVLVCKQSEVFFPAFLLYGSPVWASLAIGETVKFHKYPEFSNNYLLRAGYTFAVKELFMDALVEYFINHKAHWHIEGNGSFLVIHTHTFYRNPESLKAFMDKSLEVMNLLLDEAEQKGF